MNQVPAPLHHGVGGRPGGAVGEAVLAEDQPEGLAEVLAEVRLVAAAGIEDRHGRRQASRLEIISIATASVARA